LKAGQYTIAHLHNGEWFVIFEDEESQTLVGRSGSLSGSIKVLSEHSGMVIRVDEHGGDCLAQMFLNKRIAKDGKTPGYAGKRKGTAS
jgi:hypothetical protein